MALSCLNGSLVTVHNFSVLFCKHPFVHTFTDTKSATFLELVRQGKFNNCWGFVNKTVTHVYTRKKNSKEHFFRRTGLRERSTQEEEERK